MAMTMMTTTSAVATAVAIKMLYNNKTAKYLRNYIKILTAEEVTMIQYKYEWTTVICCSIINIIIL
eukprot:14477481-Ditylum_brightwellii.AAC.1